MADEEVKIIAGDLMVSYNMCGTKNKFYNKIIVILWECPKVCVNL